MTASVKWIRSPVLLLVVVLVLVAAACGNGEPTADPTADEPTDTADETPGDAADEDPLEELVEAATAEGQVVFYTSQNPEQSQQLVDAFEAEYPGITVELQRLAPGALVQRYAEERGAGVVAADVMVQTDPNFIAEGDEEGWWVDLSAEEIPALADWPEDAVFSNWVGNVGNFPLGIMYNSDIVGDEPFTGWEDLLDPQYEGQIILVDPIPIGTFMALSNMWLERYGPEFLEGLAAQNPQIVESGVPGSQSVAAGEYPILVPTLETLAVPLRDAGAPVYLFMPEFTTGSEQHAALSSDAPHPNAAKLFLNFLLTTDGQSAFVGGGGASLLPNVPGTMELPSEYQPARVQIAALTDEQRSEIARLLGLQ